jgi:hypothetical protein
MRLNNRGERGDTVCGRITDMYADENAYHQAERSLLAEAADPNTPPERLREIAEIEVTFLLYSASDDGEKRLLAALAGNPNTPPELLLRVGAHCPEAFARNPVLPLLPLEMPDLLTRLDAVGWSVVLHLLRIAETPTGIVNLLLTHREPETAEMARQHVRVAGELDPAGDEWERAAWSYIERLPHGDLDALFELVEYDVVPEAWAGRLGLCAVHPPEDQKRRETAVRFASWRRKTQPQEPLPDAPDGWERFLNTDYPSAIAIAQRPDAPAEVLLAFMRRVWPRNDPKLLRVLLRNPNLPPEALRMCVSHKMACLGGTSDLFSAILAHPAADETVLSLFAEPEKRDADRPGRFSEEAVVTHPAVPRALFHELWEELREKERHRASATLRRLVRWHPYLNEDAPEWPEPGMDAFRDGWGGWGRLSVRLANTLAAFLYAALLPVDEPSPRDMARYPQWQWRLAAVLNPYTSEDACAACAEDGHRVVRAAARARLLYPGRPLPGIPRETAAF